MTQGLVRIIVNPISGRGQDRRLLEHLALHLRHRHFSLEVCRTEGPGDARRLAASTPDDAHCIVSIGGDGTHREVLAGLLGRPVAACVVPGGTENVFARTFRLTGTLREILGLIQNGRPVALDVGLADDHPFVMFSGIGFDAAVTHLVHSRRRGPIDRGAYYAPVARLWLDYDFPPLAVKVDGRVIAEDAGLVVVANTPMYADRLRVAPDAVADDGLLDVVCYRTRSRWSLLWYFMQTKLGTHIRDRQIAYQQGRRIEVTCARGEVPFQVDGDAIATTPVVYTVRPRAVRLLVRQREKRD